MSDFTTSGSDQGSYYAKPTEVFVIDPDNGCVDIANTKRHAYQCETKVFVLSIADKSSNNWSVK